MSFIIHKLSFDTKEKHKQLHFSTDNMTTNIMFSIIIGSNGTGKSLLLSKLINVFKDIESKKRNETKKETLKYYYIKYQINEIIYTIEKDGLNYNQKTFDDIEVPSSILALSFLPEDKFTYQSQKDNDENTYKYLGIRSTGNAVFTGAVDKKISTVLFDNISNKIFCAKIVETFDLLGYKPKMEMKFDYKLPRLVKQSITKKTIDSKISKLNESSKFKNSILNDINEEDKNNIVKYVKRIKKIRGDKSLSKVFTKFTIDFSNPIEIFSEYKIARHMVALDLLTPPIFELEQKSNQLGFEKLSSGEKNLLFITLNILANVKDNALIIIDEPEVSLHPNWQIKYNVHLKKILTGFHNIHIFIATHSHFMVSGLEKEESNIFTIHKDKTVERIKNDIYSWSAENILYNIFNVRTVSNYYMKADLDKLLKLVATNDSVDEIIELHSKLNKYSFHKNDPLIEVLNTVYEYIENRSI